MRLVLGLSDGRHNGEVDLFGIPFRAFRDFRRIGYLPQRVNAFNPIFPASVGEVVGLGLLSGRGYPRRFSRDDRDRVMEALRKFDVLDLERKPIGELSGGQQQRVFLARATVGEPDLLVLDEPATALDPDSRGQFYAALDTLRRERDLAIIMITHDIAHAGEHAETLLYLDRSVVFSGKFSDFCGSKEMEGKFGFYAQHMICHQHDR
jgi:zinc transport system ATP-binding protein